MTEVKINGTYKHFKGHIIKVIYIAKNIENMEDMVIYHHIENNEYWARPLSMFISEVDHEKYPDIKQKYRFELVGEDNE